MEPVESRYQPTRIAPDEDKRQVVIGVRGLSVGHTKRGLLGRKTPVFARDIPDFDIHEGVILGLMGSNGVGKSTLARTLCGLAAPLNGMVLLNGTKASRGALTRAGFLVVLVDGDNRGLADDDALAAHGDKRICGAEVDGKIARIATEEHIHQRKQRNS